MTWSKVWDLVFFFMSAAIISGMLLSIFQLDEFNLVAFTGWIFALIWMLIARGWKGAATAYKEAIDSSYQKLIEELSDTADNKNEE